MSDDLALLDTWCDGLLARLEHDRRRLLARELAKDLREENARRIAEQKNPDGSDYEPRRPQLRKKGQRGRLKTAMFTKLRTSRFMHLRASQDAASVVIDSAAQRIATVHHYGLRDRVNKRGLSVQYPERKLLGFNATLIERIRDRVIQHLAGA